MSAKNNPTGFRAFFHFMSCWGAGDALVLLVTTVGGIALGSSSDEDSVKACVALSALVIYGGFAILTRPPAEEPTSEDDV